MIYKCFLTILGVGLGGQLHLVIAFLSRGTFGVVMVDITICLIFVLALEFCLEYLVFVQYV